MPDDAQQAVTFHDATKYYSLSETNAGDERIGIGDPALRSEAIWQKDWDIKPFLYKVYETPAPDRAGARPAGRCPTGARGHRGDGRGGGGRRARPGVCWAGSVC